MMINKLLFRFKSATMRWMQRRNATDDGSKWSLFRRPPIIFFSHAENTIQTNYQDNATPQQTHWLRTIVFLSSNVHVLIANKTWKSIAIHRVIAVVFSVSFTQHRKINIIQVLVNAISIRCVSDEPHFINQQPKRANTIELLILLCFRGAFY